MSHFTGVDDLGCSYRRVVIVSAVRREYLQDILKAGLTARLVASYRKLFFTRRLVEGDSTRNQTGYNFIIWQ